MAQGDPAVNAHIGPYIALPCLRCAHTLGNHSAVMGICLLCVDGGGPCR